MVGVAGRVGERAIFTTKNTFFSNHVDELALVVNAVVIKQFKSCDPLKSASV